jgi:hypothetical protein
MRLGSEMARSRLVQDDSMVVVVHLLVESSLEHRMEVLEALLILASN